MDRLHHRLTRVQTAEGGRRYAGHRRIRLIRTVIAALALVLAAAACGGEEPAAEPDVDDVEEPAEDVAEDEEEEAEPEPAPEEPAEPVQVRMAFPVNAAILHGFIVAEAVGYYEDEGLDVSFEHVAGGPEVTTQLLAENVDMGVVPLGSTAEAVRAGHGDELRSVSNIAYGGIFQMVTLANSGIQTAEDLEGVTIGVSDLGAGEMPVVRGMLRQAGLDEEDVSILPVGETPATVVRAFETGEIDTYANAFQGIVPLQVHGLDLNTVASELDDLPSSGIVTRTAFLEEEPDAVEGFLRATSKGYHWAQVDPDATVAVLEEARPEWFADESGYLIFEAVLPVTWSPEGVPFGYQTADSWVEYFDYIGLSTEGVDFDELVVTEFVERADYDPADVEADVAEYMQ